jgi:hypothetical protein
MEHLDIYSRLNVEMDADARNFLQTAKISPRHFTTTREPWSLWIDNHKITHDLDNTIYEAVHAPGARAYWARKQQVDEEVIRDINWPAIKNAATSSSLTRRIFITKHSTGMCGVGKFMARWRQRESPACPRCGAFEDATHVWKCHGLDTDQVWENSLDRLQDWMESQDTDPDLVTLLIDMLCSWRDETPLLNTPAYGLELLVIRQQELGGQALLEGRMSYEWEAY